MSVADLHRADPAVSLAAIDPASTPGLSGPTAKAQAEEQLARHTQRLAALQYLLWAENRRSLLVVLQGMDTSGKDGVARHVFSGINPQGITVTSFGPPTPKEADHDFLWRIHAATPGKGEIAVFNRSHYEDVVVVRVRDLVPEDVWRTRYETINTFERLLTQGGTTILKFFLHISREEQRQRLKARLEDPLKNWKFSPNDLEERKHWDEYIRAYQDAVTKCTTPHAPWFVIPSDRKWYRNWAVAAIVREALEAMDPRVPPPKFDPKSFRIE